MGFLKNLFQMNLLTEGFTGCMHMALGNCFTAFNSCNCISFVNVVVTKLLYESPPSCNNSKVAMIHTHELLLPVTE